jgi:ABC-type multidrug transport system fused ATPase/permease subunit
VGRVSSRVYSKYLISGADIGLIFCWDAIPTLMTAVALATYAILNQELTPSIAFTTLGVFSELEDTLSKFPELTMDLLDAYVSVKRIEEYLKAPERPDDLDQGESVAFKNASIAWPSDQEENEEGDRYILRNINLEFPEKKLSVISGKTGSGKSLLLASILGEADLLSGTIEVPKSPPICDRCDDKATPDNWIIQSSIAFVAQVPWIENATIKDNILYDLPFNSERYQKVIKACALQHDLRMLVDGELTEIGANGINLSGGQRWRVSFARALYSRAGILVLVSFCLMP